MTQPPYEPQQPYYPPSPPVRPQGVVAAKNPAVALILGLIWPGLGHLYAGEAAVGLLSMFLVSPFLLGLPWIVFTSVPTNVQGAALVVGWLIAASLWVMMAVLGYTATKRFNLRNGIEVR